MAAENLIDELLKDASERMAKSLEAAHHEFSTVRTGRASPSLLDRIVIADPEERPTDVVELLRLRAAQLLGDSRRGRVSLRALARLPRGLLPR